MDIQQIMSIQFMSMQYDKSVQNSYLNKIFADEINSRPVVCAKISPRSRFGNMCTALDFTFPQVKTFLTHKLPSHVSYNGTKYNHA